MAVVREKSGNLAAATETEPETVKGVPDQVSTTVEYPHLAGIPLALIICSLSISVFLCALDETIIVTAIPKITDDFHSLQDVGWYGSAYFMTFATFQLVYGKLFSLYPIKTIFAIAIAIFEIGSLICGTAPSSPVFILGRALAGLGSSGINAGFIIILAASLPLERRPVFVPCYAVMYGLAAVVAPLLGGALAASDATWRWCFYLNLPLGGLAVFILLIFCHLPEKITTLASQTSSWKDKMNEMDIPGTGILIPSVVSLLLALQWGGASQYAWNSPVIIALLVLSGLGLGVFVVLQIYKGDRATIPPRIIKQRSVACSACFVFFASGTVTIFQYYLPIWFQAIQNVSPLDSGIRILPTTLSVALFSFLAGLGVAKTGYYTPFMIVGVAMLTGGAFFTATALTISSPSQIWIGSQLLFGTGAGIGIQQAHTAAQTVLEPADVPTGAVILIFSHVMGGVVFIPVAQSIFTSRLLSGLEAIQGPGKPGPGSLEPKEILNMGANGFRDLSSLSNNADLLKRVLEAYNCALTSAFLAGAVVACAGVVASLGMEWISIRKKNPEGVTAS
ncbi:Major facilitator superfamily domain containing protein [Rhypophila decipiens]